MHRRSLLSKVGLVAGAALVATLIGRQGGLPWPVDGDGSESVARAFAEHRSDVLVQGSGTVARVLADDDQGSRHQRFILRMRDGQTLLMAHNIDLAPRVPGLRAGDTVRFQGEYEWNDKGGVVHWTHHDPDGRHPGGWLEHDGSRYE